MGSTASAMLDTYPADLGRVDLARCIEACVECSQACTACADACLSEPTIADLTTTCIRSNLDCADICDTTGRVLSGHTGYDANLTRAVLQACAQACRSCADECARHAGAHEHCRVCADVCRRCEQACTDLLSTLRGVGFTRRHPSRLVVTQLRRTGLFDALVGDR
jgi:hypothetical protein